MELALHGSYGSNWEGHKTLEKLQIVENMESGLPREQMTRPLAADIAK